MKQLRALQEAKEKKKAEMKKRGSILAAEAKAEGGDDEHPDTLFAALAVEETTGDAPQGGNWSEDQLTEEQRAMLNLVKDQCATSQELHHRRSMEMRHQHELEEKMIAERKEQQLDFWAQSFGEDGDEAAIKIQKVFRGGHVRYEMHNVKEQ